MHLFMVSVKVFLYVRCYSCTYVSHSCIYVSFLRRQEQSISSFLHVRRHDESSLSPHACTRTSSCRIQSVSSFLHTYVVMPNPVYLLIPVCTCHACVGRHPDNFLHIFSTAQKFHFKTKKPFFFTKNLIQNQFSSFFIKEDFHVRRRRPIPRV